jgi:tetratricopeptide (TPR) repeat protein
MIRDAKALIAAGSVDEAFAKFQQLIREGGDVSALRTEMARAFYERGMKQSPPSLTDLRRAFDLDPSALAYYESFLQASYERGLDSARNKRWNDATKEFTQAIRTASELLAKSEKAMYHNRRGTAYHWRGIAEVQKFKGKSGHLQIRSDYRQAKADYEAVLKLEPEGPFAREARDNLENVNNTLRQLR